MMVVYLLMPGVYLGNEESKDIPSFWKAQTGYSFEYLNLCFDSNETPNSVLIPFTQYAFILSKVRYSVCHISLESSKLLQNN